MKKVKWFTMKYMDQTFDVKWSLENRQIEEIRSIDSEINIAPFLNLEVKNEIQDLIIAKGTHHAI